jgi:acetoin utilization deacetylase AcuC-like enzyme
MTTILYTHPDCLSHVTPPGHPERVDRLHAIAEALGAPDFAALDRREAPLAERVELLRCHPEDYVARIEGAIPAGADPIPLDADTHIMRGSLKAALRAVGGCCAAVDAVLAGEAANAFVATRPPGHHAERAKPMGFCLFGNVAIAAKRALDHHGLSRVAVMDFDVHHGNGTQDLLWSEARARFVSTHQMPLWPGSGHPNETGGHDNVFNVPLAPGTDGAGMRRAMTESVLPALEQFAPELLILSAGFDAHRADPLAQLMLEAEDFAWITERLYDVADAHCGGRVVSALEGGYDLAGLADSTAAHVKVLMKRGQKGGDA